MNRNGAQRIHGHIRIKKRVGNPAREAGEISLTRKSSKEAETIAIYGLFCCPAPGKSSQDGKTATAAAWALIRLSCFDYCI